MYRFIDNFLHKTDNLLIKATETEAIFKISKNYNYAWGVGELISSFPRNWDEIDSVCWESNFPVMARMVKYGKEYSLMSLKKWR
jgi:hypothetical protein